MSDLTVVTVTYNSARVIGTFLSCLEAIIEATGMHLDVVIVDNGSSDATTTIVGESPLTRAGTVDTLLSRANRGYGYGINLGVSHASLSGSTAESLLIANPDVEITPDSLNRLLSGRRSGFAAVGPRIVGPDGVRISDARTFPSVRSIALGSATAIETSGDAPIEADWISGGVMLWDSAAFDRLGGFDDEYFLFYEDVDLCRRAWSQDYRIGHVPSAVVRHCQGDSHGNSQVARSANRSSRRRYARRHLGWRGLAAAAAADLREFARQSLDREHH